MRIRRMTVVMPARLRHTAAHEARRIAQAAAEQLIDGAPRKMQVDIEGRGQSGHGLAASVARGVARNAKGRL